MPARLAPVAQRTPATATKPRKCQSVVRRLGLPCGRIQHIVDELIRDDPKFLLEDDEREFFVMLLDQELANRASNHES